MIKSAYFPNQEFKTNKELFSALKKHKDELIGLKKASILNSDSIKSNTDKLNVDALKGIDLDDDYSYHVINTTKYMDSHSDVHMDGIWNKSVSEQQGKVYFVADHDLSIKSVIAYPKDVEVYTQDIPWRTLGKDFDGSTQALIFKVAKDKIVLESAKSIIENKIDIEHSIRMQYVNIELAINEDGDDYKEEKKNFDNNINKIANKGQAIDQGYFWVVSEAKISQEGSMVLRGSNDATPILESKTIEETIAEVEETKQTKSFKRFMF